MYASVVRVACLLWLCGGSVSTAADLNEAVPGHAGLTYFHLMKLVVTDLDRDDQGNAVGHAVVPFRHIEGKDSKGDPPETITLNSVQSVPIPGDDSRLILLSDLGPSEFHIADAKLLALFVLAPLPKLLDVVEVGTDRFTGLRGTKPMMLAPRTPLIIIDSEHHNSNQSYHTSEMIFIKGDRFRLIDSIFTLGEASCAYRRTQELSFSVLAGNGPHRALRVAVEDSITATGEDCNDEKTPQPHVSTFQVIYRWDPRQQRFVARSTQLKRLSAANLKRL